MSLRPVMLAAAMWAGAVASSYAEQPALSLDPLADLRLRVETLERENQQLKTSLLQRLPRVEAEAPSPSDYVSYPEPTTGGEDARIRSVVENYLSERMPRFTAAEGLASAPTPQDAGIEVGQDLTMSARWNNGLELATKDKAFRVHVGGRWQFDTSWFNPESNITPATLPGLVGYHDGVDFRRARLRVDGTMYEWIDFAFEYDFVNNSRVRNGAGDGPADVAVPAVTDLWMQFNKTPLGHIRVGSQKEAIGFEHIVSSRFLPFMERSYNQDTFYGGSFNGFTPGITSTYNFWDDRASYNIGLFKPTNSVFGNSVNDGDYAVTGRLTYLPIYENEGRQLLHLGLSARQATTYHDPSGNRIRFRTRDAIRAGLAQQWPVPADISVFGDTMQWVNFELAALNGPWTLQAEWLVSITSNARFVGDPPATPVVDNLVYHGGYVQLLYFLTGESDTYSLERMAFDRMKPFENAFWMRGDDGCSVFGRGAWQIGARYNYLDLNDQGINGGQLHNLTVGLNWFFNPNTKWQFNYMATYRDSTENNVAIQQPGTGWIHGWGMRFAQDF